MPTRRRSTSASSNSQSGWELELGRADTVGSIAIAQSGFASAARSAELRNHIGQHCRYTLEKVVLAAVRKIPNYEGIAALRVNAGPQLVTAITPYAVVGWAGEASGRP